MSTTEEQPDSVDELGGERKSFWDHLNDLRTALLRSAIAVGLALIGCLFVADHL